MIPGKYDIIVYRGSTYMNRITARSKESGLTTDFTKYDIIRMHVKPPWASRGKVVAPVLELDLLNGRLALVNTNMAIDILLNSEETRDLDFDSGIYDIELVMTKDYDTQEVLAVPVVDKILYGKFTVMGEVTNG